DKARAIVEQYAKGGSNPDLQIRAVQYLGTFRTNDSRQTLADVYASVSEANADLRREAIRNLGILQAGNELAQLYSTESNAELKDAILEGIFIGRGTDKLIEIAKAEKDPALRAKAIRYLGTMRNEKAADALTAMYPGESDKTVKV